MKKLAVALSITISSHITWAATIFDDFNTSAGHFGYAPTFSSTTTGLDAPTSSNTYDSTPGDPFEGAGTMRLVLTHNTTPGTSRVRYLSGGPPYTSANAGNPAANTTFSVNGTTDGFIGLYVKTDTSGSGWNVSFNLDSSANTGATMSWSGEKPLITDGQWHLYEWAIDSTTWSDHTDVRPTILNLVGLKDDYIHDGRVVSEVLEAGAIPFAVKISPGFKTLAQTYKQLNAPFGQFAMATLKASTKALASGNPQDDSTYTSIEGHIQSLTQQRDALATEIKGVLDRASQIGSLPPEEARAAAVSEALPKLWDCARARLAALERALAEQR